MNWIKLTTLWILCSTAMGEVDDEIEIIAREYARNLIQKNEIVSRNGVTLSLTGDASGGGIWQEDTTYFPGGAIFVSVYDYNKDGHKDLGISSSLSPYISELWVGGVHGYSKHSSHVALGGIMANVGDTHVIKHHYDLNATESIDSYFWLSKNTSEFATVHSWNRSKILSLDDLSELPEIIADDRNEKLQFEAIDADTWVSWIVDLLEEEHATWVVADELGGRFGLGEVIDLTISTYEPTDLILSNLRERLANSEVGVISEAPLDESEEDSEKHRQSITGIVDGEPRNDTIAQAASSVDTSVATSIKLKGETAYGEPEEAGGAVIWRYLVGVAIFIAVGLVVVLRL